MAQKDVGNKVPIYKLKKTYEVMKYYDEWGEGNKYDQDMVDWNYTGPKETSEVFIKYQKNKDAKIYDAVMCVGTFTFGHVKPPALDEFIRITKNKGLICFTINEGIHEEYGFDKKIEQLNKDNKWKEIEFFKSNYIASKDVNAWLGLYEVLK